MAEKSPTKGDSLQRIEFDRIEVGADGITNPRTSRANPEKLRESIAATGLKNPLRVWHRRRGGDNADVKSGKVKRDRYILISGFGRFEAIREIRKTHPAFLDLVPCVVEEGTFEQIRLGQLVEQVQHEDWNSMDVADAVIALTTQQHPDHTYAVLNVSAVAQATGKTETWLNVLLKVRQKCSPSVVAAVRSGKLPVTEAAKWASFDPAKQAALLKQYLSTKQEKGTRAANRETRSSASGGDSDAPVCPGKKEQQAVRASLGILNSDAYWKGAQDALGWATGINPKFRLSVAKAVSDGHQKGGRDKGKKS